MSTNSSIAVKQADGYKAIYCHWDGYPSYMLPILNGSYNTEELASKLISFGDASSIDTKLEPTTETHSFDNPEEGVCVFYHRDRNEDWNHNKPGLYLTKKELFDHGVDWFYIFEDGQWNVYKNGKKV